MSNLHPNTSLENLPLDEILKGKLKEIGVTTLEDILNLRNDIQIGMLASWRGSTLELITETFADLQTNDDSSV